jgi:hypothetical protein
MVWNGMKIGRVSMDNWVVFAIAVFTQMLACYHS